MLKSLTVLDGRPSGVVVYRGPSLFDGSPVALVVTGLRNDSENSKTGSMVQTYILPDNGLKVHENVFAGTDTGVCGDCPHRYVGGSGSCYVNPITGSGQVAISLTKGSYTEVSAQRAGELVKGHKMRLGAYGDPAMIPQEYWLPMLESCGAHTGYTHQWRKPWAQWLKDFCMASVESEREADFAQRLGWRTYRILEDADQLKDNEISCPASEEAGKRRTCSTCMACSGGSNTKRSVAIVAHGPRWKVSRINKLLKAKRQRKALPVYA
jgi:hypothetical protein